MQPEVGSLSDRPVKAEKETFSYGIGCYFSTLTMELFLLEYVVAIYPNHAHPPLLWCHESEEDAGN